MSVHRKVVSLEQLLELRAEAQRRGRSVVHCHGCFDIVHPGHIHHLEYARSLGDMLIVSVSADPHVNKGVNRPLIPDDLRARSLAALECVDAVYLNDHPTAVELLEQLRPDVFVKGREYEKSVDPRFMRERSAVESAGGRVVFTGGEVVYSSTALIHAMETTARFDDEKLRRLIERHELSPARLASMVDGFAGMKVVVVGDYILDRYHFCEALGIAGEAPVMSLRSVRRSEYDGGAGVIARHLAGLGCRPTLVSLWAEDDLSAAAEHRLKEAGVELRGLSTRRSTVVKERYLVEESKVMRVEEGAPVPMDSRQQRQFVETLLEATGDAAAVIFADFGYGCVSEALIEASFPVLRAAGKFIAADVSGAQASLLKFKGADLLTPTEREARGAIGDTTSGLGAVVAELMRRCESREAMITLGRQGLIAYERPAVMGDDGRLVSEYVPAMCERGIDPLGCGDALLATATAVRASGGSLAAAALLGAYAAAVEVSRVGNVPITLRDLEPWLLDQPNVRQDLRIAV